MKVHSTCYDCLKRLVYQAAELATDDPQLRALAIAEGMGVLDNSFSYDEVSIVVATEIHSVIKKVTANPDPYLQMKQGEIDLARELFNEIKAGFAYDFQDLLKLSALGNNLDFFRPFDVIRNDMRGEVQFVIDHSETFEMKLKHARQVLYLADNAGEVFFDLPLLKWMRQFAAVIYVVKSSPVQNDITMEDIQKTGLAGGIGESMTTGTATPGIIFSMASTQFRKEFETADLIFAKGMGYYESLSELPAEKKVFYCLKAKCQPVADSLGVPFNSFVAMLR